MAKTVIMKFYLLIIFVLGMTGCRTHSQCEANLYQSYFASTSDDYLMLRILDRGETNKAQVLAVSEMGWGLRNLRKIPNQPDADYIDAQKRLTAGILKYVEAHKAELSNNPFSTSMLTELKRLLTNDSDIRRTTEIIEYVSKNSTNQLESFDP